jgi:hypothetical protein
MLTRARILIVVALAALLAATQALTQSEAVPGITSPHDAFGASIGDDYFLATYSQLERYWKTLDRESDRMTLVDIGRTEEGRSQWMAIVSAPDNLRHLDRYRDISRRLSLAQGLSDDEAHALAREGKAIVWIDGGLHADEVLGAQQLIELVYELVSRSDRETLRFLRDVIVLAVDANPDGHELVSKWYMREPDPHRRSLAWLPVPYQKYVGHDDNRDFYMSTQAETINMNRVLYHEWFPQIVYDHHQTGPPGTVMFAPPFRDPFNYVLDPLIPVDIDLIGAAMHERFAAEGKAGVTMRTGSNYSTWWNGGLRTTAYFHNQIGLLTETIGSPTPTSIPYVPGKQLPSADLPLPIAPQPWHFRQSIAYSLTADRAVLDIASRRRETLLYDIYRMGRNSIERGSTDTWTPTPHRPIAAPNGRPNPALRDPRGYIISADQPDFLTATKFVQALLAAGVVVDRATAPFTVDGRNYPAGSYVVKTAQAFRPHVLDMFEPQDYPDDIPYPGATPTPPYDSAGWTLAFQMGIAFDRVLDAFDGPFEPITTATPLPGRITGPADPAGYLVSHRQNDAFIAVNRLLAAGESVYWLRDRTVGGAPDGTGMMYIEARPTTRPILQRAAQELGLDFIGVRTPPPGAALKLRPVRIALWDRYGGSTASGWMRWLLERYEFPFQVVYAKDLDGGALRDRFDVIVFSTDALPGDAGPFNGPPADRIPAEYRHMIGSISWSRTLPRLKDFVDAGGTVLTIGQSSEIAERLGAPITDGLTRARADGSVEELTAADFYIPGSILRARVDNTSPLGFGFEPQVDVFFDHSPSFRLTRGADADRVAWYDSTTPLRSGWAWGQRYLDGTAAVVDAPIGHGRVLVFGPEITYRAQSHGTFKFLFNGLYYGAATPVASLQRVRPTPDVTTRSGSG